MHSFQNFIVRLIPSHPPPLETRIWKLVVRALYISSQDILLKGNKMLAPAGTPILQSVHTSA